MDKKPAYKVLITTSGTGSRLGDITKYTNKSLVKIGKKPAISYIIEAYPKNTPFVITVGYFANQVRDFLDLVYPDRKFEFVEVKKYEGPGTSLGYSMLQAAHLLRCPFIYHACDTIVTGKIPAPKKNWIGGFRGEGSSHYASFDVFDGRIQQMYDKGTIDPDFLHIGLVGIADHASFWKSLKKMYERDTSDSALGDVYALRDMIEGDASFQAVEFEKWYDIGNVESLHKARAEIDDSFHILDKVDESIFLFEKSVVKFFAEKRNVSERVERAKVLGKLVPKVDGQRENFYQYRYVKGDLYSEVAAPTNFREFLDWSKKYLWKREDEVSKEKFQEICRDFYVTKTQERIKKFLTASGVKDGKNIINGEEVPSVKDLLKKVDFDWLCTAEQSRFHGDFILDNIIRTKTGYTLLDWRQNFGGLLRSGDMYYDLAKLNHNLTVNHGIVNQNLFTIEINGKEVTCDILRKENLVQCQKTLFDFLERNGYDSKKVRILTALIWLNMSPLHHHPFDLFLFYFGKLNLWRALNEK